MANNYKRWLCEESLKSPSSRPILIYFEFRGKPPLITVEWIYYEIVYIVFSYLLHTCIFRSILNIVYLLSSFRIVKSYWLIVLCIYISY